MAEFGPVNIPQGSTIVNASLYFLPSATIGTIVVNENISADDVDNSTTVGDGDCPIVWTSTSAVIDWDNVGGWTDNVIDSNSISPNISTVIQEIVNRGSWVSGNHMSLVFADDGSGSGDKRTWDDVNLVVIYSTAANDSSTKSGLIQPCFATPFCTNTSNPYVNYSIASGSSVLFNWTVNATGDVDTTYNFFANVTLFDDISIKNNTNTINITIVSAPVGDCCDTNTWDCSIGGTVAGFDAGGNTININNDGTIRITDDITNCNQAGIRIKRVGACELIHEGNIKVCET